MRERKIIAALVLSVLQGKGKERKEAFLLTAFWLLCGDKVTATAATERSTTGIVSIE